MPERYSFLNQDPIALVEGAPKPVREAFVRLLEALARDPFQSPGVLPAKGIGLAAAYTAPFGDGLLLYQVMADYPAIKLIDVFWV